VHILTSAQRAARRDFRAGASGAALAPPVGMHLDPPAGLRAHRSTPTQTTAWTDLEQEFFASAPPDEPEPPAEPAPRRRPGPPRRRILAIVLGAVVLLIGLGLSAAVLAARS